MKRYTVKRLEEDLVKLNLTLEKLGHHYRIIERSAYEWTMIYLATPEEIARHCTHSLLESGSPRECYAKASQYVGAVATQIALNKV